MSEEVREEEEMGMSNHCCISIVCQVHGSVYVECITGISWIGGGDWRFQEWGGWVIPFTELHERVTGYKLWLIRVYD